MTISMSVADLADSVAVADYWKVLGEQYKNSEFKVDNGISYQFPNVAFNCTDMPILFKGTSEPEKLKQQLETALQYLKSLTVEKLPKHLNSLTEGANLALAFELVGMGGDFLLLAPFAVTSEVAFGKVDDYATTVDFMSLSTVAYGQPHRLQWTLSTDSMLISTQEPHIWILWLLRLSACVYFDDCCCRQGVVSVSVGYP